MASYLICYDPVTAAGVEFQLAAFVKNNRHVTQWLRPFTGCYVLKSNVDLTTIGGSFQEFFGQIQHIITPVNGPSSGGILPEYAWKWLNEPEPPSLGTLLSQYLQAPDENAKKLF